MLRLILVGIVASILLTLAVNLLVFATGVAFKLLPAFLLLAIVIFVAGLVRRMSLLR